MNDKPLGPFTWQGAQYRLVPIAGGLWALQDIRERKLVTLRCRRRPGPDGPFWAWEVSATGERLATDPRGAVNTWLAAHGKDVAA